MWLSSSGLKVYSYFPLFRSIVPPIDRPRRTLVAYAQLEPASPTLLRGFNSTTPPRCDIHRYGKQHPNDFNVSAGCARQPNLGNGAKDSVSRCMPLPRDGTVTASGDSERVLFSAVIEYRALTIDQSINHIALHHSDILLTSELVD